MKLSAKYLFSLSLVSCFLFLNLLPVRAQGVLNKDQVEGLRTRWLDTKKKKTYLILGDFGQQALNPKSGKHKSKMQTYKRTGKVPFRLWVEFGEIWELKGGRNKQELLVGQMVYYYIKDANGTVVKKDSSNVGKLARRGSAGGVFADLPRAGTYTCVFYVKKENMLFGKEVKATFVGYK